MRRLAKSLLLAFVLVSGCTVQAPEPSLSGRPQTSSICSPEAQEALDAGELSRARQGFLQAAAKARQSGNSAEDATCSFYLGLVAEREAQREGDSARRRERLAEAAKWYEEALAVTPRAPGVVTNLAYVYSDLGQRQRADQLFAASLRDMKDGARGALARSYARFLEEDDWSRSAALYRQALEVVPTDDRTWEDLLALLTKKAPAQLPDAVWKAVEAGQTSSAQKAALTALQDSSLAQRTRVGLLAALVGGLAEQQYPPAKFPDSEVAVRLGSLKADPTIGRGVEQVLLAHQGSNLDAKSFAWWAEKKGLDRRSPLSAFRSLLRSLAMRVNPDDPLVARAYLETAEKLSPETFDPLLSGDLLINYAATGDIEKIESSERHWETLLRRASSQLDPVAVERYQLTVKAIRQGLDNSVREASEAPRVRGVGGAGHVWDSNAFRCVPSASTCPEIARLEIPDLFQHPGTRREELRTALIEVGCTGRHLLGHHPASEVRTARFVPSLPSEDFSRRSFASMTKPDVKRCHRVPLAAQPAWLSSAAWTGGAHLLLADSLRGQLLRYATDGTLLETVPPSMPDGDAAYVRVQSSPIGIVTEDGFGRLLWGDSAPRREVKLVGRMGREGTLKSVFQWSLLGSQEALAVANLLDAKGSWTSAVIRLPLAGEGYETLYRIDTGKPESILYRVGIPALASAGGAGYFLALEQNEIGLYRVPARGGPQRLATFPGVEPELRGELARDQNMRQTPDLFRLLERTSLPTGLYGVGDDLFLLRRVPKEKHPGWALSQLDPRTGRTLRTVSLPTAAPHLTVAPGERSWAFFEKSSVQAIGQQATPSMLLVPTAWIQGRLTAAESGCDSGILPTANASTHPSPPPPVSPSP